MTLQLRCAAVVLVSIGAAAVLGCSDSTAPGPVTVRVALDGPSASTSAPVGITIVVKNVSDSDAVAVFRAAPCGDDYFVVDRSGRQVGPALFACNISATSDPIALGPGDSSIMRETWNGQGVDASGQAAALSGTYGVVARVRTAIGFLESRPATVHAVATP